MFWFSRLARRQRPRRRPQAYRYRPRLEVLEGKALPSILVVTNPSDTGVPGDGSLRGEIAAAANGDTIEFAGPVHGQTIALSKGELALTKSLDIEGPVANPVVISGNNASRVLDISSSSAIVTLSGLTITQGTAEGGFGGGIYNTGALTVSQCTLSGNNAIYGGGIYNLGTLTVSQSTLSGNLASFFGGGITNAGTLTVSQSTLSGNSAGIGGGIANSGTVTVSHSTLSGNSAVLGGGINNLGTLTISQSTLSGNSADLGGGINNLRTLFVVHDSTICGNSSLAPHEGADLYNTGSCTKDDSSTICVIGP